MAFDNNRDGGFQRQMFQGNWKCAQCGADITELPFQPDPSRLDQLRCRDCHKQRMGGSNFRRDAR